MTIRHTDLFELLEPPPGGLALLRARLHQERPARTRWLLLAGGVTCAVFLALALRPPPRPHADLVEALRALETRGHEPVTLEPGQLAAIERLPSQNPQVILYRVAMLGHPASSP